MKNKLIIVGLLWALGLNGQSKKELREVETFVAGVHSITEVMFHDVINPPAAARFYAYATLAAHHVVNAASPNPNSFGQHINNYPKVPVLSANINPFFAATYAMLETAKAIIPSGMSLEEKQQKLEAQYLKAGVQPDVLNSSKAYAVEVGMVFAKYAAMDGYLELSVLPRYEPQSLDSTWYPTPPQYMMAVEPHWRTIKTFYLRGPGQFQPAPPVAFDDREDSEFYQLMTQVYEVSQQLTPEQELIADFWDCNPFANLYSGHVMIGIKKISPGGHWMGITGIVSKTEKLSFNRTVEVHAVVATGLHDAFVSCWDEKYRSDRIRPKTAINRYLDQSWSPILETPPFPEYTSGHSVISTTSAELLTYLIGDHISFVDNTEVFFGLPIRKFESFRHAANEAAISRLYGGIHFLDAIEEGQVQGKNIAEFIISKMESKTKEVSLK